MAVAFFFVLGGFSMTLGYKDRLTLSSFKYGNYLMRRCCKFYPLHWLCLLAAIPLSLSVFDVRKIPIFLMNAALVQTWIPINDFYFSFNKVSWYLADTMFFTLVFPLSFKKILKLSPISLVAGFVAILGAYISIAVLIPKEWYHAMLYINPFIRFTDFLFGVNLALFYLKQKDNNHRYVIPRVENSIIVALLIMLLVVESCVLEEEVRLIAPLYWPFIGLLILTVSLQNTENGNGGKHSQMTVNNKVHNWLQNRYLYMLGKLSFIIFLVHQLVLRYTKKIFDILHFDNSVTYVTCTFLFTILISLLIDRYILKSITKWLTKRKPLYMTAQS